MSILPKSGLLGTGGGKSNDTPAQKSGGGFFGGAFGIGKGSSSEDLPPENKQNQGSRAQHASYGHSHGQKPGAYKASKINNDGRGKFNKSTGDRKPKEVKIKKGEEHKRNVSNAPHPKGLAKGDTTIYQGDIVTKDPHGGWLINGTHFHDGAAPWETK